MATRGGMGGDMLKAVAFRVIPVGNVQMYTGKKMCRKSKWGFDLRDSNYKQSTMIISVRQLVVDPFATCLPIKLAESNCLCIVGRSGT